MSDPTAEFFQQLGRRGHEPLLEKCSGAVRFDIADRSRTDHWLVHLNKGDISVSQDNREADCVVRTAKSVLNGLAKGEVNALSAYLRGLISLEGDPELLVLLQRVFPSPQRSATAAGVRRGQQQ
jgi:putative sterol carrier protein